MKEREMGSALEIGIQFRRVFFVSIRRCYRSVCNHPFLVAFLGFLFLLYRCFPFLFSVLVSASPVLVCTAVLLGTLLSFGQPIVPEIEKEEEKLVTHGFSPFQTVFSEGHNHTVITDREEDEGYFTKGYSDIRSDVEDERGTEEASLLCERDNRDDEDHCLLSDVPPEEKFRDGQPEKQVKEEAKRELLSHELGKRREVEENLTSEVVSSDEDAIEKQYVMVQRVDDDTLDGKNEETLGDHADFSASSSWRHVGNSDDEEQSVASGSDQAESSSPDASMADIIPMLDELHPLLDLGAQQPAHLSRDGSDVASEKSRESDDDDDDGDDDSVESDEDAEQCGEGEEGRVDGHDYEEEEETDGGNEDESKSAIKWTEDDQKNLMDLGTLELERNQRLENLIARRRMRRMMTEKNLIDLDAADIPANVAPIVTKRNPFDFPDESYTNMGLPPIPGSAPSIMQPRRNPFDIPYDSNEEKPDLKGDSFQQEFAGFNQKDAAFFRRHESFSMGPSVLGIFKHERHDFNWKPVFISERMASEGTSYSSFQRQSSGASDSKMSSVPDTESVSSTDQDERKFSEQDLSQEAERNSSVDHFSDGVEHGSQSSGENDSVEMIQVEESMGHQDEAEIVLGGAENPSEMELDPEASEAEIRDQFIDAGETPLQREPNDEESSSSSRSSHSSSSEVIDSIPEEKIEESETLHQRGVHHEEPPISRQISGGYSTFQHVEPVYDSSPPATEKLISFPSVSSDSITDFPERVLPTAPVEMTANMADKESDVHEQRPEDGSSGFEETQAVSFKLDVGVENELRSEISEDISQGNVPADEFQDVPVFEDSNMSSYIGSEKGVTDSSFVHGQDLADHEHADSEIIGSPESNYQMASEKSHLSDDESMEEGAVPGEASQFASADMPKSIQDADKIQDMVASDSDPSSNASSMPVAHDSQLSPAAGQSAAVHPNLPSEETEHIQKFSPKKEDVFQIEQDRILLSRSAEQDADKLTVAPSSSDYGENQVESVLGITTSNDEAGDLNDAMYKTPLNISYAPSEISESPEFRSPTSGVDIEVDRRGEVVNEDLSEALEHLDSVESHSSQVTEENVKGFNDIKEIDEGFLSELDTIGDFNVNDAIVSLHTNMAEKMAEVEHDIPILEARSLEDINLAFKQLQEGVDVKEVILPSTIKDQLLSEESKYHQEAHSDLQVVEAKSLEDIDIALNQISKGNHEELPKSLDLNDITMKVEADEVGSATLLEDINLAFKQPQEGVDAKEVIHPCTINDQPVSEESKDRLINDQPVREESKDHLEASSGLQVVEARSLEDIDISLNKIPEGNQGELPKPLDLNNSFVKVEADEAGLAKAGELTDVATSTEEPSRTLEDQLESELTSSSSKKGKSHNRKSSSSSSSSSTSSDSD